MARMSPSWAQQTEDKSGKKAGEGLARLWKFKKKMKEEPGTPLEKIQKYGKEQAEKEKREKEEKEEKKKKGGVAPQKGFIQRMMDKYWYKKKEG